MELMAQQADTEKVVQDENGHLEGVDAQKKLAAVDRLVWSIAYMFWNHSTTSFSWEPIDKLCEMFGYSLEWTPEGRDALLRLKK
ncbi:MAG: hypothetical protein ACOX87_12560 [Chloroflexota bacterium]